MQTPSNPERYTSVWDTAVLYQNALTLGACSLHYQNLARLGPATILMHSCKHAYG